MTRCKPRAGVRTTGARTTVLRDYCRSRKRARYLTRGGRPRSSVWWRAWIAKLFAHDEPPTPPPPPSPPIPLSSTLGQQSLTITFDTPLDPASTAGASQFRYGIESQMYIAYGQVEIDAGTLTVSILVPPGLPFGSGAWYVGGAGQLLGANGAVVQPFGPV